MGLPLTQQWVRILFWILPVLRSGSLIILEGSGVDLPHAQDPKICESLAVHLPHSGLGALKCCGSVFMTSLKEADILCSEVPPGCFCSLSKAVWGCFILTNSTCWDGTGG